MPYGNRSKLKKRDIFWKFGYLAAGAAVFMLDQATKAWAVSRLRFKSDISVIDGFLNFSYAQNTGVAFSLFDGYGDGGRWALSGLAFIAAALVVYFFWKTPRSDDRILGALVLLLAGIVGNVTDRVRLGFVVDFIDVQFGNWHYPTFNIADIAICTGAGLLILDMFLRKEKKQKETGMEQGDDGGA
ncbi:MAG: signal peptidase II [Acidobacteria bacterium]|nr:MAG: signal peptidase II [Acidobacteriota bacterium]REJ99130.1 MAG: signal peptidase II [Acidobacteriota bacterium]REK16149.1 MAG: signal peptidase II [Acidobacteriota bacterium]REK43830.1 MAG: signal peptidase II [Acidobacteriota bacterium]